ncbi:hypothetical protein EC9_37820 [Rosistilla ulvae]|uniref:Carboxypeptidase regulatory-like domain-containing protein n=1 Tax=Rosistilla ulvae TaxID=1930277 RepID=A0A517M3X1_9BACT|nr:carboxypeptidase-like regulatory domain-containing protein [Rosistilla ulvae]QDS89582.1 hypothetical protein EC9_37820 [Rosistilla ulvae]
MRYNVIMMLVAAACAGCGSPSTGPSTVSVQGTVTLDGKPVEGADVYFISGQFSSSAKTDAAGVYDLVGGAIPGPNTVYISKLSIPAGAMAGIDGAIDEGQMMAMAGDPALARSKSGPKQLLPPRYSDPGKTELKVSVPDAGGEAIDFGLESK